MNKNISYIIITLSATAMLMCGCSKKTENPVQTAVPTAAPTATASVEPTPTAAPTATPNPNLDAEFKGSGYAIKYSSKYSKREVEPADFLLIDDASGSNVNVVVAPSETDLQSITQESYGAMLQESGISGSVISVADEKINGIDAKVAKYSTADLQGVQYFLKKGDSCIIVSYTKTATITADTDKDMQSTIESIIVK